MCRTQKEVDVMKCLGTEQSQSSRVDTQYVLTLETANLNMLFGEQSPRCLISSGLKQWFPRKWCGRHWSALF
jgi:hypothetical protein